MEAFFMRYLQSAAALAALVFGGLLGGCATTVASPWGYYHYEYPGYYDYHYNYGWPYYGYRYRYYPYPDYPYRHGAQPSMGYPVPPGTFDDRASAADSPSAAHNASGANDGKSRDQAALRSHEGMTGEEAGADRGLGNATAQPG
jgi:hypothetical protein